MDTGQLQFLVVIGFVAMMIGIVVSTRRRAALRTATAVESPALARRLAQALVEDIVAHNKDVCSRARRGERTAPFDDVVNEGRVAFAARTAPALHGLYDDAVDAVILRR